jgi:hypothetical protein
MPRRNRLTGLTDAELATLAEEAYAQRDDADAWEAEEPPEVGPDVRSVVSVRFNRGELGPIERAAIAAGVPVSTYIRNAAINAVTTIDLDEAGRTIRSLRTELDRLEKALGGSKAAGHSPRAQKKGKAAA